MKRICVPLVLFLVCDLALATAVENIPQWKLIYGESSCLADLRVYHQTPMTPMVSLRYQRAFDDSDPMFLEKIGLLVGHAVLHVDIHFRPGQRPPPPYSVILTDGGEQLTPLPLGITKNGDNISEFYVFAETHAEQLWKGLATPGRVELLVSSENGESLNYTLKIRDSAQAAAMIRACVSVKEEDRG